MIWVVVGLLAGVLGVAVWVADRRLQAHVNHRAELARIEREQQRAAWQIQSIGNATLQHLLQAARDEREFER